MREGQVVNCIVVLAQAEDGPLLVVVPDHDVRVVASLAGGEKVTLVGDGDAGNQVIMSGQEVLTVWIIKISRNDTASGDEHILLGIGMEEHGVVNLTTKPNGMIELNHLIIGHQLLSIPHAAMTGSRHSGSLRLLSHLDWWKLLFCLHF